MVRLVAVLAIVSVAFWLHPTYAALCTRKECSCKTNTSYKITANCSFGSRQRLTLGASDFPEGLYSVWLVGGKELRFGLEVLAKLDTLEQVHISNVTKVFVQKHSFANLSSNRVLFSFEDVGNLLLEEGSFTGVKGPISCRARGVRHLVLQRAAFAWLSDLILADVAKLELLDEAFLLNNPLDDTPFTTITLERVNIDTIGRSTFHSSAKEIRIVNSKIGWIKADAFDAIVIHGIVIENSTVRKIESGAFNDRTFVVTLRLSRVNVLEIAPGALSFGSSQLIIEHSRINHVQNGAINITVAEVTLDQNVFGKIYSSGVRLHKWNSISLTNNLFKRLETKAFLAPVQPLLERVGWLPEWNFTDNTIFDFGPGALDFALTDDVAISVDSNHFLFICHCDMSSSLETLVTGQNSVYSSLYETGYCKVDPRIARCFGLSKVTPFGVISMTNFSDAVCEGDALCGEERAALPPVIPVVKSAVDDVVGVEDEIERERLIMGSVLVLFVLGMVTVLIVSLVKWIKDYTHCHKTKRIMSSDAEDMAVSNSVLSLHVYEEVERKTARASVGEDSVEDKATQTLPEELSRELLQALRQKLSDPVDYREARHMIEHLYDMINRDEGGGPSGGAEVSEYAEPRDRVAHLYAEVESSPEAPLCEYSEPKDLKPSHLEPNSPVVPNEPALHLYTLPTQDGVANRPLPLEPS